MAQGRPIRGVLEKEWPVPNGSAAFVRAVLGQRVGVGAAVPDRSGVDVLPESAEWLRLLADRVPAVLWTVDRQLRFTSSFGAGLEGLGLDPGEVSGLSLFEFFGSDDETFAPIVAHRRALAGAAASYEFAGMERAFASHVEPLRDRQGAVVGAMGIALDITEQRVAEQALRESEAQLRQSQKMEAIGRLAGGIAHDFNNLLTAILGHAELLHGRAGASETPATEIESIVTALAGVQQRLHELRAREDLDAAAAELLHDVANLLAALRGQAELFGIRLAKRSTAAADLEEIIKAAERASELTRQLLAFSRRQLLRPRVIDLNAVVAGTAKLLRRLIGEDIELRTELAPELGRVLADPSQIEQVLMNLAVNARDAMPAGGKLVLATADVELDEAFVRDHPGARAGAHVLLAVTDTGCGMDTATIAEAFDPFFTTKDAGKGTGLGLSTVYGIVKQSGGGIWIESAPNAGASFRIYLPRVDAPLDMPAARPRRLAPAARSGTVLLVEDEPSLRTLLGRVLADAGYTVHAASGPAEALQLWGEQRVDVDLILTDVVMPQMSGPELVSKLAPHSAQVLYMSGYAQLRAAAGDGLAADAVFISKPFTPAALIEKVREVLDRPALRSGRRGRAAAEPAPATPSG